MYKVPSAMRFLACLFILHLVPWALRAQGTFRVVPLGTKGGLDESNLSAYLLAPAGRSDYLCLDAGTLYHGLQKAVERGTFSGPAHQVLREQVKGYLISHAHLDHLAGMISNAPDDANKAIYALPSCLEIIRDHYFNGQSWPNFGDSGQPPVLRKYRYVALAASEEMPVEGTAMFVRAYPLSHGSGYESAAFLVRHNTHYVLYLGDTGPDDVEQSNRLAQLWAALAPLVRAGQLKGIFIEASYPNEQPDRHLYGHLTPRWLLHEMAALAHLTTPELLRKVPIIITHMKPTEGNETRIREQLRQENTLGLTFLFPEQGVPIDLP
ncbi:MBL fold metallo-hydrolase [Rhabdobacter roseus]|nr:3',5'-cyclic-nucleotide phosphodiesterase [Rhabdobacter roseus]